MKSDAYTVILLVSVSHTMKAEKILQAAGIACKLIPVPRRISSQCGACLRVLRHEQEQAKQALHAVNLEIEGVYDL